MAEKRKNLPRNLNVCVVGAAGGIGQPLSLLLRGSPLVKKLSLYDVAPVTPGVAVDLSHISDDVECVGYGGNDGLDAALKDANYVLIPAGVARKPGMTRDDLFNINASIVASTAKSIAKNCPSAHICLITNPINSTVPLVAEVLKRIGCYNPKKLYGITTLDLLRASTFVHGAKDKTLAVPVIGGHAGITILPLLSQLKGVEFTDQEIKDLTQRIMFGGDEVVKAKAGGGSATLSMAFAANTFFNQLAYGILGGRAPIMPGAYIESSVCQSKDSNITFFSTQFTVNQNGIDKISEIPFSKMSKFENEKLDAMLPELKDAIIKGVNFGRDFKL
jgi:malate dehydrogenase